MLNLMFEIEDNREYSREQTAGILNMGVDALMRRVKANLIKYRKDGRKYYFKGRDIKAYIESTRRGQT